MHEVINTLRQILKEDELFELSAKTLKKSLDAIIKEGFTREEAMQILVQHGPLVQQSRRNNE